MNKKTSSILTLLLISTSITTAQAATATGTFNVSATVLTSCTIAVLPLAFGNYDPASGTDDDATTTATVTCTGASSYTIAMNVGIGSGATFATRKMTSGAATLDYSIYTDAARTTVWGDGTSSTSTVAGTGILGISTHTVYGRIPAGQSVDAGLYNDTITVTLTY
jgi:spore coat protein U-like protein